MRIVKRFGILALCLLLLAGACGFLLVQRQAALSGKLLRLHVVANSDSDADQALKLQVRDRILETLAPLSAQCRSRDEMAQALTRQLGTLRQAAEQTLRQAGCTDEVSVQLQREAFPTRYYDGFALPAGDYLALRVSIGEADGHNWWCVCFPALCTAAESDDFSAIAASGGFTEDEISWMRQESGGYRLRFWLLERLQTLLGKA